MNKTDKNIPTVVEFASPDSNFSVVGFCGHLLMPSGHQFPLSPHFLAAFLLAKPHWSQDLCT